MVAVDALGALVQLSRDANVSLEVEAEAVSRATEAGAPAALLAAIESNFQAMVGMLTEVLHNLQSSLEKLARNKRQAQQLLEMGDASSAIASNRRVKVWLLPLLIRILQFVKYMVMSST